MTLAEAPFWVWGLLVLNSSLFLFMALTPYCGSGIRKSRPKPNYDLFHS